VVRLATRVGRFVGFRLRRASLNPKNYSLRVGALERCHELGAPARQIWAKRRVPWLSDMANVPALATSILLACRLAPIGRTRPTRLQCETFVKQTFVRVAASLIQLHPC
jgi:hypothetical protein